MAGFINKELPLLSTGWEIALYIYAPVLALEFVGLLSLLSLIFRPPRPRIIYRRSPTFFTR
jgi:hypothetical protein